MLLWKFGTENFKNSFNEIKLRKFGNKNPYISLSVLVHGGSAVGIDASHLKTNNRTKRLIASTFVKHMKQESLLTIVFWYEDIPWVFTLEEAVLIADHKPLVKILGAETDYLADTLQKWTLSQTSYHYDIMAKISEKQSKAALFLLTIRDEKLD